ncbi:MAG: mobile mystery protein B [Gammaproteobacteria bacterium]|nr:mobile mystery protein B [Gammaproteobacteria bacterium]
MPVKAVTLDPDYGSTPLTVDEQHDLLPTHLSTHQQLNAWEQANIQDALGWLESQDYSTNTLLEIDFVKRLHKKMFSQTWKWAGKFRTSERNLGVDPAQIAVKLKDLLDDTKTWIKQVVYDNDEIAVRFHHRLVLIHPFPNGNGRHARMLTNALLVSLGQPLFTWGINQNCSLAEVRSQYIAALRAADKHNIEPLIKFVKT